MENYQNEFGSEFIVYPIHEQEFINIKYSENIDEDFSVKLTLIDGKVK